METVLETPQALSAFDALSQETRLDVFRLLIRVGDKGLPAGEISQQLGVLPNTLSTNLNILVNAGLVQRHREGRSVRYFANFDGLRGLLRFLMKDCCGGKPEICDTVIAQITCG